MNLDLKHKKCQLYKSDPIPLQTKKKWITSKIFLIKLEIQIYPPFQIMLKCQPLIRGH